jgi:hypothetical protein
VIERMQEARTLCATDGPVIQQYVQLHALTRRLQDDVDGLESLEYPKVSPDGNVEPKMYPQVAQLVRARSSLRLFLSELGLTPSSRDRVPTRLSVDDLARQQKRQRFFGHS